MPAINPGKRMTVLKYLLGLVALAGALIAAFIYLHPVFGGTPDEASMARMKASPNFNGKIFVNRESTELLLTQGDSAEKPNVFRWLASVTSPPPGKQPAEPVPVQPLDKSRLANGRFAWFGHSTVLMKLDDKTILTDPVFNRASPIFLGGAPFPMTHTPSAAEMPELDAVLISHDHYDHLDWRAVQELDGKTKRFYVPLGVKAHLQRWGIADDKITELDWNEGAKLDGLEFILAPSRHFSGRRLSNRFSTLWGSWVIKSPSLSIYFNADSGYGKHFADNARAHGPFDVAFMENGAYNEKGWPLVHMTPEQSVQASVDLGAKHVIPVHWGKFDLAYHPWKEPIERFLKAAHARQLNVLTPGLGEVFDLQDPPRSRWWEKVK